jgi:hypothetical protein
MKTLIVMSGIMFCMLSGCANTTPKFIAQVPLIRPTVTDAIKVKLVSPVVPLKTMAGFTFGQAFAVDGSGQVYRVGIFLFKNRQIGDEIKIAPVFVEEGMLIHGIEQLAPEVPTPTS